MSWLFIHERKSFPPITMTSNSRSDTTSNIQGALNALCSITRTAIGLLQLAITWYKIGHAGGQAHYYSRNGILKQRDLNQ